MSAVSKFQELSQVFFPQDHDLFWKNVQDGNLLSDLVFQNFISEILQEVQYYAGLNQTISSMVPPSTLSQFYFYAEIQKRLRKPDIKIDLGAGVRLFHLVPSTVHIVVEHFEQYLQHLKYSQKRSGTILIQDDAISFLGRQPTASTDLIVAIDLIEHLRKEDGLVLIKEMKRVSRGQCLIVTPLGFVPQHIDQEGDEGWGFKGNVSQKHISGWLPEEFDEWEVLVSRDFPLNTHPFGNLAAIYTHQESVLEPEIEILVLEQDPKSVGKFLDALENSKQEFNFKKRLRLHLPLRFHPNSFGIYPNFKYHDDTVYYIENPDMFTKLVPMGFPGRVNLYSKSKKFSFISNESKLTGSQLNFLKDYGFQDLDNLKTVFNF